MIKKHLCVGTSCVVSFVTSLNCLQMNKLPQHLQQAVGVAPSMMLRILRLLHCENVVSCTLLLDHCLIKLFNTQLQVYHLAELDTQFHSCHVLLKNVELTHCDAFCLIG